MRLSERCTCGASLTITTDTLTASSARQAIETGQATDQITTWRKLHAWCLPAATLGAIKPHGDVVYIARCPIHGLHGERTECFVCGGPVERVAMEPVPATSPVEGDDTHV